MNYDYSQIDIENALREVGIVAEDNIFVHSNIGFFGRLKGADSKENMYKIFKNAIFSVIGRKGTIIVPTFSYSFCKNEVFDVTNTQSVCGLLSECIRTDAESFRSEDANFSVAAIGENAVYFTQNVPENPFGESSFFDRFLKKNGKVCNFNFDAGSTFIHYVERSMNVPYRHDKKFQGKIIVNGIEQKRTYYHYVRELNDMSSVVNMPKFHKRAKELGIVRSVNLGKGQIVMITAENTFNLIKKEMETDPYLLVNGNLNI